MVKINIIKKLKNIFMKKLLVSTICSFFCITLFAQTTTKNMTNLRSNSSMNNDSMLSITTPMPKASLPVLETYISTDIVSVIKQKTAGGDQLYDITAVTAVAMPQSWDYVVRVIRNGSMVTEKMDSTGNLINQ